MRFKEKDIIIKKMVNNFRDCDEGWRGRSEVQSTWEKIHFVYCNPRSLFGTRIYEHACFMKFRYLEDYKKNEENK